MKNKKLLSEYFAWGKAGIEKENRQLKKQYKEDKKEYETYSEIKPLYALLQLNKSYLRECFFWQFIYKKELKEEIDYLNDKIREINYSGVIILSYIVGGIELRKPCLFLREFQPTKEGFYKWLSDNDKL